MKNKNNIEGEIQGGIFLPNCCISCNDLLTFPGGEPYCRQEIFFPIRKGTCKNKNKIFDKL